MGTDDLPPQFYVARLERRLRETEAAIDAVRAVLDAPPGTGTTPAGAQAARDALVAEIRAVLDQEATR